MVNNKIKQIRLAKHLSQEQLAEKSKVSVRTIQRLEAGEDASISTLNLVAGALGVEVGDLFPKTDSDQQQVKIQSADEQLQYQLHQRREEYSTFNKLYTSCFIIVMLVWGCIFPLIQDNEVLSSIVGMLWIGAWLIMGPLKKGLTFKFITPKLDKKYPLTINRIDKNKK